MTALFTFCVAWMCVFIHAVCVLTSENDQVCECKSVDMLNWCAFSMWVCVCSENKCVCVLTAGNICECMWVLKTNVSVRVNCWKQMCVWVWREMTVVYVCVVLKMITAVCLSMAWNDCSVCVCCVENDDSKWVWVWVKCLCVCVAAWLKITDLSVSVCWNEGVQLVCVSYIRDCVCVWLHD